MTYVIASIDGDLIDAVLCDKLELLGVFDRAVQQKTSIPYLGDDTAWHVWSKAHPHIRVLMPIDKPNLRRKLVAHYGPSYIASFISTRAYVSERATLGKGCIVQRDADISAGAVIGDFVKINIGANVHHDCKIGDFTTLAPGCRLLGNVTVEEDAYIGADAVILPRITIGAGAVVGAGAIVTQNIAANITVAGVPARPLAK